MNGFIDNEPSDVYHGNNEYLGRSTLVECWRKSYAHTLVKKEPTAAMTIGSAVHDKIYYELMGDLRAFDTLYITKPEGRFKKGEKEAFLTENANKTIMSIDDMHTADQVARSILTHPVAKKLLDGAILERSFYCETLYDGKCHMKARPDAMRIDDGIMIDFKSAIDASFDGFSREVFSRMLDIQAAHYFKVAEEILSKEFKSFIFIACEKTAPYAMGIYSLDQEVISESRILHDRMVYKYMTQKSEELKGYPLEIKTITLPQWRRYI